MSVTIFLISFYYKNRKFKRTKIKNSYPKEHPTDSSQLLKITFPNDQSGVVLDLVDGVQSFGASTPFPTLWSS